MIEFSAVHKRYPGGYEALRGVSFTVADGEQIFLAVVSNTQLHLFCEVFEFADLRADMRLATNVDRVNARQWMMPILYERMAKHRAEKIAQMFEKAGLPFAPITKPHELFDDAHLLQSGGLADIAVPADCSGAGKPIATKTPLLPLMLNGTRPPIHCGPPSLGQHTQAMLSTLGTWLSFTSHADGTSTIREFDTVRDLYRFLIAGRPDDDIFRMMWKNLTARHPRAREAELNPLLRWAPPPAPPP